METALPYKHAATAYLTLIDQNLLDFRPVDERSENAYKHPRETDRSRHARRNARAPPIKNRPTGFPAGRYRIKRKTAVRATAAKRLDGDKASNSAVLFLRFDCDVRVWACLTRRHLQFVRIGSFKTPPDIFRFDRIRNSPVADLEPLNLRSERRRDSAFPKREPAYKFARADETIKTYCAATPAKGRTASKTS